MGRYLEAHTIKNRKIRSSFICQVSGFAHQMLPKRWCFSTSVCFWWFFGFQKNKKRSSLGGGFFNVQPDLLGGDGIQFDCEQIRFDGTTSGERIDGYLATPNFGGLENSWGGAMIRQKWTWDLQTPLAKRHPFQVGFSLISWRIIPLRISG